VRSVVVSVLLVAAPALAQDAGEPRKHDAKDAAESGNFLPYSTSPSTSQTYATLGGGYDAAQGGALASMQLQLRLQRRVYLQLSGNYQAPDDQTLEPQVSAQVIVLVEKEQGVDLMIVGGWEHEGFNQVPDALGRLAVGRHVGGAYLLGSAAMGFAYDTSDRYGELTLGGLGEVLPHLYAGLDSRGRRDLGDAIEPNEDAWSLQAGPIATYVAGPIGITAVAGVSALRQHRSPDDEVGAMTMLGVGAVF
jgi:hypothetical protein